MNPQGERSLGELFADLAKETGTLVRQEVGVATTELSHKAAQASKQAAVVGTGGAFIHVGVLALGAAAIAGLATMMALWIAALIVGGVVLIAGYALVTKGMAGLRRIDPMPRQTVKALKDNKVWAKRELSR